MSSVFYSGYAANTAGVRIWPSRELSRRWEYLVKINTGFLPEARRWQTTFVFTVGRSFQITSAPFLRSSMARYAEFLALAIARAPASAEIDARSRDIARWGTREIEARIKRTQGLAPSVAQWVERARFHRARLQHAQALKAVDRALQQQPGDGDTLELRWQLLEESGANHKKLIAAAEEAARHAPGDARLLTRVYGLKLQANDARVVPDVEQALVSDPDNAELGFALAGYFFRAKDYDRAMVITDALSKRLAAADWRRSAAGSRDYVQRYATSAMFRVRERLKFWGRIAAVFLPLALLVGAKLWVWHAQIERNEKEQRRQLEARAARVRAIELEKKEAAQAEEKLHAEFAALKKRADAGEADAQYRISRDFFDGRRPASKDPLEARRYLELASAQKHPGALLELGQRLKEGDGLKAEPARAVELLTQAVEQDSARAAVMLGRSYMDGVGVNKDPDKALALYRKAAAAGDEWGDSMVGWALETGIGATPDLKLALASYQRAADKKVLWAYERLVYLRMTPGQPHSDPLAAWRSLAEGAEAGSTNLQTTYAGALVRGGVEVTRNDELKANRWLETNAAAGDPAAQYFLGEAFFTAWQRPLDFKRGAELFASSAEKEYPLAMWTWARCLAAGVGTPADLARAKIWRDKLSALHYPAAELEKLDRMFLALETPRREIAPGQEARPAPIWQESPQYPHALAAAGVEGWVVVEFKIGTSGKTLDGVVVKSSNRKFEAAALAAVAFWRFHPGYKNGKPVVVRVSQQLEFQLNDSETAQPVLEQTKSSVDSLPPVEVGK